MIEMGKRLIWLDALKGWGICFIVLGHIVGASVHLSNGGTQSFCAAAYKYFYAFHVPLFFFVAGITFHKTDWIRFFSGKWRRLGVPYFVVGGLSALLYWCVADYAAAVLQGNATTAFYEGKASDFPLLTYCWTLLTGFAYGPAFAPNAVLWFIPALFALTLFGQILIRITEKRRWWLVVAVALWIGAHYVPLPSLPWGLSKIPSFFLFLALGYCCGQWAASDALLGRWKLWVGLASIVAFGAIAVWNPFQYRGNAPLAGSLLTLLITCGNIMGWYFLSQAWPWRGLAMCGAGSLAIMVFHKFPVLLLQNVLPLGRTLFQHGFLPLSLGIIAVFLISLLVCLLAYRLCIRFLPWLFGDTKWPPYRFANRKGVQT